MSRNLVRRWRRVARQWGTVAQARLERELITLSHETIRAEAYARVFNECADSLERSLVIAAGKPRKVRR
jgi:hypothetical protein